jgi:hypothetical protein
LKRQSPAQRSVRAGARKANSYQFDAREGERREEDAEEDVDHPLLRVLRADRDDPLRVLDGTFLDALDADVPLDELDRAVGARCDRLHHPRSAHYVNGS